MKQLKAIHDLFRFEDDLFRNEAEIFQNEACTSIGQNTDQRDRLERTSRIGWNGLKYRYWLR